MQVSDSVKLSIPSLMGSKDVTSEKPAAIFVPDLGATA